MSFLKLTAGGEAFFLESDERAVGVGSCNSLVNQIIPFRQFEQCYIKGLQEFSE